MQPKAMVDRFLTSMSFKMGIVSEIVKYFVRFIMVDVFIHVHKEKQATPRFAIYGMFIDVALVLSGNSLEMVGLARTIIAILKLCKLSF